MRNWWIDSLLLIPPPTVYHQHRCGQELPESRRRCFHVPHGIEVDEVEMTESVCLQAMATQRDGDPDDFLIIRADGELDACSNRAGQRGMRSPVALFPVRAGIIRGGKCCNDCVLASL